MRKLGGILLLFGIATVLGNLNVAKGNTKIQNLVELRKSILDHEKELNYLHGITSSLVGETGDALKSSKKVPVFAEVGRSPSAGIPSTSIKMTMKFPNIAPVHVSNNKIREEIDHMSKGEGQVVPNINPIPLVVIRPDALTNMIASLSASVHQRKKVEDKRVDILEKLLDHIEDKDAFKRVVKRSINSLESELAFFLADKSIAQRKS
ncbi:uncharacterized protein CMU_036970 [Cryptosporidium muris RN66]|uniref:Uncharacterized protein n=1 Tax=Cryptosporidium muris (strain RN66) TaxID=441375 RepID=B6AH32_CRYMR|nr:uncharacterized protein CMU_036970 [Cryptosporidium muris RN66]EEA07523.1 hypothetical protein, conserved [Cryptosporidium muris RN66]|eukprot:XP_002141872.1 hypothetical protein [Cryptosporidium muris RN66]